MKFLMWCSFCQPSLLQLRLHSYFLSHTLMGSVYLCYVDFSLVAFSNGVMTNDRWCRDDTESLLWCTHGWVARHALVSRLIVVIHYETTDVLSFVDILFKVIAAFCLNMPRYSIQINLQYLVRFHLMNLHLSPALGVTCFSTPKDPHLNLGMRFF
jgi:hypothetical protein